MPRCFASCPFVLCTALLLFGALSAPVRLPAQAASPAAEREDGDTCSLGRISSIFVDNHSVFDLSDPDLDHRLGWAFRLANRLHVRTREEVIRREILLKEGDCYDPALLRESERVLRASGFLADADVFAVPQPDGSYHVVIDTRDDWSTRVELQMGSDDGLELRGIELRDDNLLGYGRQVSAFYLDRWDETVYGFSFATPQLFRTRWDASIAAGKTPTGHFLSQSLAYPFIGESGRWAFRQQIQHQDRYFGYLAEADDELLRVLLPRQRRSFDVGGMYRFGRRRNLTLLGTAITGEWISYPAGPRLAPDEERDSLPESLIPPAEDMDSVSSVRAMFMVGQRQIRYVRRRGFDTVRGTEDVRLGWEAELGVGRSIPGLSSQSDLAVEFATFGARELGPGLIGGAHLFAEAKQSLETEAEMMDGGEWRDVFAQFDAWMYLRRSPEDNHTYVATIAAAGGWNTTVPFQLTLGGDLTLRGYPHLRDPGGQRLLASLERRDYLGWPYPHLFDLGTVVALEAGRVWAGDVPYGIDSPLRASLGLGIRAALPPGSRRTFRLDVGIPLASGVRTGDLALSVGVGQVIGATRVRKDPQLERSSRRSIAPSLFTYPY